MALFIGKVWSNRTIRTVRMLPVALLALGVISCRQGADNTEKIVPGLTMNEVKDLLGEPKKTSLGREDMVFAGADSLGTVDFRRSDSSGCITWEYYVMRYENLPCKGPTFTVDLLHGNRESRQPGNSLRVMKEYQVIFGRGTEKVLECGFRPVGFVDIPTGQPAICARVEPASPRP